MPIEQVFETQDAAPEFLRDHLTERDGKFVFTARLDSEITGLQSALQNERNAAKTWKRKATEYESKLKEFAPADDSEGEGEGDEGNQPATPNQPRVDPKVTKELTAAQKLLKRKDEEAAALKKELDEIKATQARKDFREQLSTLALKKAGVKPERCDHLVSLLQSEGIVGRDDNGRLTIISDSEEFLGMSVEEALKGPLVKLFPWAYEPIGGSGSGADAGNRGGGGGAKLQRSKMDAAQKAEYIRKFGGEEYGKLPW